MLHIFVETKKQMENFIAYYRLSVLAKDKEQANSYGFQAQHTAVEQYVERVGGNITASYQEVETGTKRRKRVEVYKAIAACKQSNSTLIVAKLDRLARDCQFVAELLNSGIKFLCVENPSATPTLLQIMASIAEAEATSIRQRIKAAFAVGKSKGKVYGRIQNLTSEGRAKAVATRTALADCNINNIRAKGYITVLRNNGLTYQAIADKLNSEGFLTATGKAFTPKAAQLLYIRSSKAAA